MGQATKLNVVNKVLEQGEHWLEYKSGFEKREYKGEVTFHKGDDLLGKDKGTDYVVAIDDGIVTKNTYSTSRGYYVELKMNNGFFTRYLHLKKGSILVKVGQKVAKGQRLGYMGNSGYYTDANGKKTRVGTHLHFAVANTNDTCIDPMPYLMGEKSFSTGDWIVGAKYKTIKKKFKRYGAYVGNNKVPFDVLSAADKKKCDNVGGYARTKIGVEYIFYDFVFDNKGNRWGCTTKPTSTQKNKHYICVEDKTGKQVKKV
jgi:hypothetical protein